MGGVPSCRIALYANSIAALQVRTAARQGEWWWETHARKFMSSGSNKAKDGRRLVVVPPVLDGMGAVIDATKIIEDYRRFFASFWPGIFRISAKNLPLLSLRPSPLTAGMTKIPKIPGLFHYFFAGISGIFPQNPRPKCLRLSLHGWLRFRRLNEARFVATRKVANMGRKGVGAVMAKLVARSS